MKHSLLLLIATLFFQSLAYSQPKAIAVNDAILGTGNLWGFKSVYLSDHSIVTFGNSYNYPAIRILLMKTDEFGNLLWSKIISTENNNIDIFGNDMISTLDGGFLITGASFTLQQNSYNGEVLKLDDHGNLEWGKEIAGSDLDQAYSATQLDDSSYIISGETVDHLTQFDYALLVKFDPSGNIVWMKKRNERSATKVIKTPVGYATITQNSFYKFNTLDSLTNYIHIGAPNGSSNLSDFIQTDDHGYVFVGEILYGMDSSDSFILKMDSAFHPLWKKSMSISLFEGLSSVMELSNGDFIICGDTCYFSNQSSQSTGFIFELDENGNYKWGKIYADSTKIFCAVELPGRDILFTGTSRSLGFPQNDYKLFLLEIDSTGLGCLNDIPFGNIHSDTIINIYNSQLFYFSPDTIPAWNDGSIISGNTTLSLICGNFPNQVENIFDSKASVSFYPNPTTGKIYIEADSPIREIEVRTSSGALVLNQTHHPETADLSLLKPGIYFLKVVLEGGVVEYAKVLLN